MSDFSSIGPGMNGSVNPVNRLHIGSVGPAANLNGHLIEPSPVHTNGNGVDRVELSQIARYLDQLRSLPAVRHDLIAQVQQAISEGTYENEEKIDLAIERLADQELL